MQTRISALIPAYNVEEYICRAIDSILTQTYQPCEILVVDDGSTDGTAALVRQYGRRVTYVYQDNGGVSAALNAGIRRATGDWIAFLDADDEWLPHHLANAARLLSAHPELKWYGAPVNQYVHETGQPIDTFDRRGSGSLIDSAYFPNYMRAYPPYAFFAGPTMVIHRSVFERVGLFDETLRIGEDIDMWFRIGLAYPKVGYCYDVAGRVYRRASSLSFTREWDSEGTMGGIQRHVDMAQAMGEEAYQRAIPRIMHRVGKLLRASMTHGDVAAVRRILETYGRQLSGRQFMLARSFVAMPRVFRLALGLRRSISRVQRAKQRSGLIVSSQK